MFGLVGHLAYLRRAPMDKQMKYINRYIERERLIDEALINVDHCSSIRMRTCCSVCIKLAEKAADEELRKRGRED